jgi:glutamate synthase domain-containing protein 1/glutamate synthase domain-containing protein 3
MGSHHLSQSVEAVLHSRAALPKTETPTRKSSAEGGCGVIGIASSEPIAGRHLLQALMQMRNRGNGKGGGVAIAGLDPEQLGVSQDVLNECYLLTLAYLDQEARGKVEETHIHTGFNVHDVIEFHPAVVDTLESSAPPVTGYFVRVKDEMLDTFRTEHGLDALSTQALEDEFVYQNTYKLNTTYYASLGEKRAFVLSHGKDLLVFKLVSYGEEVVQAYELEGLQAHVWIGHHRYPTKGRVWHPGGAHPFVGLHEALVHNGDFANYAAVCEYLRQQNVHPLFLTDTEVSVLMFDLLDRTFNYPLEYVIEAMAPTTERDFTLLPPEKQSVYRELQAAHIHGSPDGPWFFLIAQSGRGSNGLREPALIGITDTSMLRPQVFALQETGNGGPSIGFAASEKQAIDAALRSLSDADERFWPRADRYWNARGGSHTDGGAFTFRVLRDRNNGSQLICTDKFERCIHIEEDSRPYRSKGNPFTDISPSALDGSETGEAFFEALIARLPGSTYEDVIQVLRSLLGDLEQDSSRMLVLDVLRQLIDGHYNTGSLRRSSLLSLYDLALETWMTMIRETPTTGFRVYAQGDSLSETANPGQIIIVDARGFPPEGSDSLARELVRLSEHGFRQLIVLVVRGQRFLGNGLGAETEGVRIEIFGSSGDYLGSGIDGLEIVVHGSAQDQVAQIMKSGRLVIYGDVGQTFLYGAKGGEAFVLGNAAGRPLINAVGKPRVVINGTCLDYLAESFMAGDPLHGGGFVILNGMRPDGRGGWQSLDSPYPGGNLFSLASGGAIFVRDPHKVLTEDQLNGGAFVPLTQEAWDLMCPLLEENARLFGLPISRLLQVDGERRRPEDVYRAITSVRSEALQPEEAWVRQEHGS